MTTPRNNEFVRQYGVLTSPEDREEAKKWFAENTLQNEPPTTAFKTLLSVGESIGEDLTHFFDKRPTVDPAPASEAREAVNEAARGAPWYRQALNKAVGAAEWWNENIAVPAAATVMATAFNLIPGKQSFEVKMEEAQQRLAAQRNRQGSISAILDTVRAAREAYRGTDTVWGLKGFMELVFDPLNLL